MPSLNLIKIKKLLIALITPRSCIQLYPGISLSWHSPSKPRKIQPNWKHITTSQMLRMLGSKTPASPAYKESLWVIKNLIKTLPRWMLDVPQLSYVFFPQNTHAFISLPAFGVSGTSEAAKFTSMSARAETGEKITNLEGYLGQFCLSGFFYSSHSSPLQPAWPKTNI